MSERVLTEYGIHNIISLLKNRNEDMNNEINGINEKDLLWVSVLMAGRNHSHDVIKRKDKNESFVHGCLLKYGGHEGKDAFLDGLKREYGEHSISLLGKALFNIIVLLDTLKIKHYIDEENGKISMINEYTTIYGYDNLLRRHALVYKNEDGNVVVKVGREDEKTINGFIRF